MGVEERFQNVDNVLIGMEEAGFFFINSLLTRFSQDYFYETSQLLIMCFVVKLLVTQLTFNRRGDCVRDRGILARSSGETRCHSS